MPHVTLNGAASSVKGLGVGMNLRFFAALRMTPCGVSIIVWSTRSKTAGIRPITAWRPAVVKSGLTGFAPFLKLLDTWLDRIANSFRHHQSSGFVEGLNNSRRKAALRPRNARTDIRLLSFALPRLISSAMIHMI